ncbi:hypothetical protein BD626DRAFT_513940 [Schizophyllum amplum]|uniref:BTB domain-containing protein n=1 Tax=Schizophyllum amplum TaxID=97359 RepID=A0A550BYX1_9AGAR|nr:hypothetical protein BD626DRAFT_513940 [Auriculariopsis ampla]
MALSAFAGGLLNATIPRVSDRFSTSTPTTIPFVSRYNTTFHIERAKLERAADFVPPSTVTSSPTEPVTLSENDDTLELLFRFVYCEVHVDLDAIPFRSVAELAEAAEKYMVYSAMTVSYLYMKSHANENALEVFEFAAKHNHRDLLNIAAPYTIGSDLRFLEPKVSPSFVLPWVNFNNKYQQIAQRCMYVLDVKRNVHRWDHIEPDDEDDTVQPCGLGDDEEETWGWLKREVTHALFMSGGCALLDLDKVFTSEMLYSLEYCKFCDQTLRYWKRELKRQVAGVRAFTTFM